MSHFWDPFPKVVIEFITCPGCGKASLALCLGNMIMYGLRWNLIRLSCPECKSVRHAWFYLEPDAG